MNSRDYIALDNRYGAHNYHPIPVVISKARGCKVWDPEGREYYDFLSAYSAVNQGHLHPHIVEAARAQLERVTLTSRAFHNDKMGPFLQKLCEYTGYEKALPMNTGVEAVETALKAARRWGVEKKGVENGKQSIICATGNFHGRTLTAVSMSNDPESFINYGPYVPGFIKVSFGDATAVRSALEKNTVAVLVEPIQGEAGVVVPPEGYLTELRKICSDAGILLIFDEIQTGFCRTGRRFAWHYESARPDIMCLGKALGGGIMPISAIVADHEVMDVFTPGTHGSTFGGNPLAGAVGVAAIEVLEQEHLEENAFRLGERFRQAIGTVESARIRLVRGKGLLNAVVFEEKFDAYPTCLALKEKGILAKQTHGNIVRFAPPLVISAEELEDALERIMSVLGNV
ncbi:MAG: ornithine--oxo-acid transaminase [Rectinema sp.]|jgi:ornithine--oxo-acid transaminase|uniref:ornithine aminotransferase n=1 Tax=uncultured spirochete TaxID=156406 RepID=A0A3P3XTA6_9SPIR|nr:Ornithine aminotransferase [uncultured spirochete]